MSLPWVMIKSNPAPSTYCRQGWLDSTCCKRGYRWSLTGWHFFPAKLSGVGLWSVPKIYKRSHFRSIRIFEMWRRLRSLINAKSISWGDHRKKMFKLMHLWVTGVFFLPSHRALRRCFLFFKFSTDTDIHKYLRWKNVVPKFGAYLEIDKDQVFIMRSTQPWQANSKKWQESSQKC